MPGVNSVFGAGRCSIFPHLVQNYRSFLVGGVPRKRVFCGHADTRHTAAYRSCRAITSFPRQLSINSANTIRRNTRSKAHVALSSSNRTKSVGITLTLPEMTCGGRGVRDIGESQYVNDAISWTSEPRWRRSITKYRRTATRRVQLSFHFASLNINGHSFTISALWKYSGGRHDAERFHARRKCSADKYYGRNCSINLNLKTSKL